MYNGTQVRHLLGESLGALFRRRVSGTVAVVIMGSALLMLALFSLVTINLDQVLQGLRGGIDIVVYLDDAIHEEDQALLHKDLVATRGVATVSYVSREEALESFRAELGDDAELLEALGENPLPASFELRLQPDAQDSEKISDLTRLLGEYPGVVQVEAHAEWIGRLDRLTRIFFLVDVAIGVMVLLSALFVISNTVRLTIEESASSVEIMKLVGATNWFIRTPYLLSGAIQGAAAGILAMLVLQMAYGFLSRQVDGIFFFGPGQRLGFVLLSTLLGAGGSMVALRRHLRL